MADDGRLYGIPLAHSATNGSAERRGRRGGVRDGLRRCPSIAQNIKIFEVSRGGLRAGRPDSKRGVQHGLPIEPGSGRPATGNGRGPRRILHRSRGRWRRVWVLAPLLSRWHRTVRASAPWRLSPQEPADLPARRARSSVALEPGPVRSSSGRCLARERTRGPRAHAAAARVCPPERSAKLPQAASAWLHASSACRYAARRCAPRGIQRHDGAENAARRRGRSRRRGGRSCARSQDGAGAWPRVPTRTRS